MGIPRHLQRVDNVCYSPSPFDVLKTSERPLSQSRNRLQARYLKTSSSRGAPQKKNGTPLQPSSPTALLSPTTLSLDGDNLALVNPELFLEQERLAQKIKENREALAVAYLKRDHFTIFPTLVVELRLQIWKLAAGVPLQIPLCSNKKAKEMIHFKSATSVPGLLHANRVLSRRQDGLPEADH